MIRHWPFELTHYHTAINMNQQKWDNEFLQIVYDILTDGIPMTVAASYESQEPYILKASGQELNLAVGASIRIANREEYRILEVLDDGENYRVDRPLTPVDIGDSMHLCGMGFTKVSTETNKIVVRSKNGHDLHIRLGSPNAMELSANGTDWHVLFKTPVTANYAAFRSFTSDGNVLWFSEHDFFLGAVGYNMIADDGNRWIFPLGEQTHSHMRVGNFRWHQTSSHYGKCVLISHADGTTKIPKLRYSCHRNAQTSRNHVLPYGPIITHSSMICEFQLTGNSSEFLRFPGIRPHVMHAGCPGTQIKDDILIVNSSAENGIPLMFSLKEEDWTYEAKFDLRRINLETDYIETRFHTTRFIGAISSSLYGFMWAFNQNDRYQNNLFAVGFDKAPEWKGFVLSPDWTVSVKAKRLDVETPGYKHTWYRGAENLPLNSWAVWAPKFEEIALEHNVHTGIRHAIEWVRYKPRPANYITHGTLKTASFDYGMVPFTGVSQSMNHGVISGSIDLEGQPATVPMVLYTRTGRNPVGPQGPDYKFLFPAEEANVSIEVESPYPYCNIIRNRIVPELVEAGEGGGISSKLLGYQYDNPNAAATNSLSILDFEVKNATRAGNKIVIGEGGHIQRLIDFNAYKSLRFFIEFDTPPPDGTPIYTIGNYEYTYSSSDGVFVSTEVSVADWGGGPETSVYRNFRFTDNIQNDGTALLKISYPCKVFSAFQTTIQFEFGGWDGPAVFSESPKLEFSNYTANQQYYPIDEWTTGTFQFYRESKYAVFEYSAYSGGFSFTIDQQTQEYQSLEQTVVNVDVNNTNGGSYGFRLNPETRIISVTIAQDGTGGMINNAKVISI